MAENELIAVVDDDVSVRESLPDLLRSFGFHVEAFSGAEDFLASGGADRAACLVLDITMPGMSGIELEAELARLGRGTRIVFMTSHANDGVKPRLLGRGAVACLFKPFSETAIVEAVTAALARE